MKYKVGDRVRMLANRTYLPLNTTGTVWEIYPRETGMLYDIKPDQKLEWCNHFWVAEHELELINESDEKEKMDKENIQTWKIVIVSTGDKTTATLYVLDKVVKEATVTRYYKDRYDTEIAAKEAVNKLFRSQGFTGKAMFVGENSDDDGFTRGKIYQFIDGQCIDDENCTRPHDSATTLAGDDWYSDVFIKVVE